MGKRIKKKWWPVSESNQGHSDFQSLALPTELTGHFYNLLKRTEIIQNSTEYKLINKKNLTRSFILILFNFF